MSFRELGWFDKTGFGIPIAETMAICAVITVQGLLRQATGCYALVLPDRFHFDLFWGSISRCYEQSYNGLFGQYGLIAGQTSCLTSQHRLVGVTL